MIRVTFTILTARPDTPNTKTITAPEFLLALKALAEALGCVIHWDGTARFSPNPHAPAELFCKLEDGFAQYDARVSYVATDATVEALAQQLRANNPFPSQPQPPTPAAPAPAPLKVEDLTGPPREPYQVQDSTSTAQPQDVVVSQTPDPVLVLDPEDGRPRVAAAWGS